MLLLEGRRPRGASLRRCGVLTLGQHYLDPGLGAGGWGGGGASMAHCLLVRRQSHLDSFHHDGHRLARHALVTSRSKQREKQSKIKNCFNLWSLKWRDFFFPFFVILLADRTLPHSRDSASPRWFPMTLIKALFSLFLLELFLQRKMSFHFVSCRSLLTDTWSQLSIKMRQLR